ncbi:Crp/Fnr family transcriptional regulator [Demequina sp.]|uniref:Crp/Fnr family transcriptional regulator n=1 Tax=Demequina sp. TaxID=2050685 RepID=UPI0025C277E6|nr:Crp/Fnr family transcriptional regulator [Demequina sp.]
MADTCVARVPVFAGLSTADQQRVAGLARPRRLSDGETAYSADDEVAQLVVVHTGYLKIFRLAADGNEHLFRILGPGEFAGETSVFTGRRPLDFAVSVGECQLCVFRHDDLEVLIRQYPDIGMRMLATVVERLARTENRLNSLTSRDVESRLATYLLGLPTSGNDQVATVTLPLAKKDVAALLDTTPESLSRALSRLAGRGLIAIGAGRSVSITQPAALRALAQAE